MAQNDTIPTRGLTPPEYAARLGVNVMKILGWIDSGELQAVNIATSATRRPRWLIPLSSIAKFEATRSNTRMTQPANPPRVERPRAPREIIRFFK